MSKTYSDFFHVDEEYRPNMTKEEINSSTERWLDFYPHHEFQEICMTLLSRLSAGDRSLWITGNYGTGKSNAALVIEKLFMDDEERVRRWFDSYDVKESFRDRTAFESELFQRRKDGTFVVYDYNASGVGPDSDLIVRLEKGVIASLRDYGMTIPAVSSIEKIVDRVRREGDNFFRTRDTLLDRLEHLNQDVQTVEQITSMLDKGTVSTEVLREVEEILHADSIYLDADPESFRRWIRQILDANGLSNIVYLFDEFHPFIEANSARLKTFEDVTESPGINRFFLVPVTHMQIQQYWAEGSENAKKANDRFYFRRLHMPNDTAFRLVGHALIENTDEDVQREWHRAKDDLWDSISYVADQFNVTEGLDHKRFHDILPIHPMAGFLLKHLSESAKSNQRSLFEYLKGGADGKEFQEFIREGGPDVEGKQFLTVDYLWNYFINRSDLGVDPEIERIGNHYQQLRTGVLAGKVEDDPEVRVLKTVLLFCLMDRLTPQGHEQLLPTTRNVALSFAGDSTVVDPEGIIEKLQNDCCFTVFNGTISLINTSSVAPEDIEKYRGQFYTLLHEKTEDMFREKTKNDLQLTSKRFEIRVTDPEHTNLTNLSQSVRERYSANLGKDDGSICLWFVIAKDREDELTMQKKIESALTNLQDHRIIMLCLPGMSFCHNNKRMWDDYIRQYARYMIENDQATKKQIRGTKDNPGILDRIEEAWFTDLRRNDATLQVSVMKDGHVDTRTIHWSGFKSMINNYSKEKLPHSVDGLGVRKEVYDIKGLAGYAKAGISGEAQMGPAYSLVNRVKELDSNDREAFFMDHPEDPLAVIHSLLEKRLTAAVKRGAEFSLRKVYIELQRAPYGLRYNGLTAFALGYCLRDTLDKGYHWTDGQVTKPLDEGTLAEIIEMVVKDDGANKLGHKEKRICWLSREEQSFIDMAPKMFGFSQDRDVSIMDTLANIQEAVEKTSGRIPLWILPELPRSENDANAEAIAEVLSYIGAALRTSSKSKMQERTNVLQEAGKLLLSNRDLVQSVHRYFSLGKFVSAFEHYVDRVAPDLAALADKAGDVSHEYCSALASRFPESSGWLWKPEDIDREIRKMVQEYEVLTRFRQIMAYKGFMRYDELLDTLRRALTRDNPLPNMLLTKAYPEIALFISSVQEDDTEAILDSVKTNPEIIKALFFDPSRAAMIDVVRNNSDVEQIEDKDLLSILGKIPDASEMTEEDFFSTLKHEVELFAVNSAVLRLKSEWTRVSGENSPDAWAVKNRIPARYLLDSAPEAEDILRAVRDPRAFSLGKLNELLEELANIQGLPVMECQAKFMNDLLPSRYQGLDVSISGLLQYMSEKYGQNPNNWPSNPDLTAFICREYQTSIAPRVRERISSQSADELKRLVLQLAESYPEIGMFFLEK